MASWVSGFKPSSKSKTSSGARARAAAKSRSSGGSNSSGGSSSTVPHDFVGPLRPGTVREAAPIQGPTRPGTDVQTFRKTGRVTPSRSPSPSQAQIAAAQAAEEVRQAELQRKQAEAKKLADEVKSVKLAKIDSQKIGGQVSSTTSPGPKAFTSPEVQAYNPEQRYIDTPYKRNKWDSTISAVGGLFADIKTGNQGSPNKYIDEYKYSEGIKRDKVAYVNPIFGTVITDPVTGKAETGEVTYGDIQRGVEDRRNVDLVATSNVFETKASNINKGYQSKIDSGELSLEQAQSQSKKEFDVLNVRYAEEQKKIYKKEKDVPGVFERTGTTRRVVGLIPDVAVTATAIGVGAVNPVAGASIGLAYFGGKGLLQGVQKPTYKEVGEQGGLFAGVTADEKGRLSITESTALDIEYKGLRKEAGVNLLIGAAYGGGLAIASAKDVTATTKLLGESKQSDSIAYVKKYMSGDAKDVKIRSVLYSESRTASPGYASRTVQENPLLPSRQGSFTLGAGKGTTQVKYTDFLKQIRNEANPFVESSNSFISQAKGTIRKATIDNTFGSSNIILPNNLRATIGRGLIGDKSGTRSFIFGGVDTPIKQLPLSISKGGRATSIKIYTKTTPVYDFERGLVNLNQKTIGASARIPLKSRSFIFGDTGIKSSSESSSDVVKSFLGGGGKSSKQFLDSLYSQKITQVNIPGFASSVSESTLPTTSVSVSTRSGGASISSQLINNQRTNGFRSMSLMPLKGELKPVQNIITGQSISIIPKARQRGGLVSKQSQGMASLQVPALNVAQLSGQLTKQKLKPRTIQELVLQQSLIQPAPTSQVFSGGSGYGFGLPFGFIKPKMAQFGKSRSKGQKKKQQTRFQTSFTGSVLGIRGKGLLPGGLSVRGII